MTITDEEIEKLAIKKYPLIENPETHGGKGNRDFNYNWNDDQLRRRIEFIKGYKAALQNKVSDENSSKEPPFEFLHRFDLGYKANLNKVSGNWIYIKDDLPPTGIMVDGYNEKWIDEDFNPEGIRECFLHDEGFWDCAKWNNDQDCWDTINETPSFWKQRFSPIDSSWQWTDSLVKEMIYRKLPIPDHYSENIQRCLDEFKKYKIDVKNGKET